MTQHQCTQCGGPLEFEAHTASHRVPTWHCQLCDRRHYDPVTCDPVKVRGAPGEPDEVWVRRDDKRARAWPLRVPLSDREILGALARAYCRTCGHLLQDHGSEHGPGCRFQGCTCKEWKGDACPDR